VWKLPAGGLSLAFQIVEDIALGANLFETKTKFQKECQLHQPSLDVVNSTAWMLEWPVSRTRLNRRYILTRFASLAEADSRNDPTQSPHALVETRPAAGKFPIAAI